MAERKDKRSWHFNTRSLPVKLLLCTILFVFIAEVLVFVPSVAKYRAVWLQERIERAYVASESLEMATGDFVDGNKAARLFSSAEILGVTIERKGQSQLVLAPDLAVLHDAKFTNINLGKSSVFDLVGDAMSVMFSRRQEYFFVESKPVGAKQVMLEIIIDSNPLRRALWDYAKNIIAVSLFISLIVAGLVYFALSHLFVQPMLRLTENIAYFQRRPEDSDRLLLPSNRKDEIGEAERVVAAMQGEIRAALRQRSRLATLGEGMSKVNHDLRNVLASAVLMSDRLAKSDDPRVQRLAPKLVQALDRAVALCKATVDYGRADNIQKERFNGFDMVDEISEALHSFSNRSNEFPVIIENNVHPDIDLCGDRLHLYRALLNLTRNAAEALSGQEGAKVEISVAEEGENLVVRVADNGPGLPEAALDNLFVPFKGSQKSGGTGLGLAIAYETAAAHNGALELERSDETGTVFKMTLPKD